MIKFVSTLSHWTRGCAATLALATTVSGASNSEQAFFERIAELCGARYSGEAVFPEDPGDAFRGKTLVAHIRDCSEDEIRIPFAVGDDHSRTWVLTLNEDGLTLKHDHRHEDGTPDEITQYGGTSDPSEGSATEQSFPADTWTAELIPEAATNEWFLSVSADAETLTYYLERHEAPRFKAILRREHAD